MADTTAIQANGSTLYYLVQNPGAKDQSVISWIGYQNVPESVGNFVAERAYAVTREVRGATVDYQIAEVVVFEGIYSKTVKDPQLIVRGNTARNEWSLGKDDDGEYTEHFTSYKLFSNTPLKALTDVDTDGLRAPQLRFYDPAKEAYIDAINDATYADYGIYAGYATVLTDTKGNDYIQMIWDGRLTQTSKRFTFHIDDVAAYEFNQITSENGWANKNLEVNETYNIRQDDLLIIVVNGDENVKMVIDVSGSGKDGKTMRHDGMDAAIMKLCELANNIYSEQVAPDLESAAGLLAQAKALLSDPDASIKDISKLLATIEAYVPSDDDTVKQIADLEAVAGELKEKLEGLLVTNLPEVKEDASEAISGTITETVENASAEDKAKVEATAETLSGLVEKRLEGAETAEEVAEIQEWAEAVMEGCTTPIGSLNDETMVYVDEETKTMTLLTDVVGNALLEIDSNTVETLDLGGREITVTDKNNSATGAVKVTGKLTIDNGTINHEGSRATATIRLYEGADVTIGENAVINKTGKAGYGVGIIEANGGSLTVKGTINGYNGITVNGTIKDTTKAPIEITIASTARITGESHGLYLAGIAKTTIEDGAEITGDVTGIEIRMGTLVVNGGTISSICNPFESEDVSGGTSTEGCGIGVNPYFANVPVRVAVLGGEIQGYYAVAVVNENADAASCNVDVSVSGATLLNDLGAPGEVYNNGPETWKVTLDGVKVETNLTIPEEDSGNEEGADV